MGDQTGGYQQSGFTEGSAVSGYASSVGVETKRSDEEEDMHRKVLHFCCLICLIALLMSLLFWTSSLSSEEEDTDGTATYKLPDHRSSKGSEPAITAADPGTTTATTSNSATVIMAATTTPTTSTKTTTTTTTPTTQPSTLPTALYRPLNPYSVVCTVDCNIKIVAPADGVCDFVFLESLYVTCGGRVGDTQTTPKLQSFLDLATTGNVTQFGCSIDALQLGEFVADIRKSDSLKWAQEKLWSNNVYNWGVMNVYEVLIEQDPDILKKSFEALKEAAQFSQASPVKTVASYTFLGVYGHRSLKSCENIGLYSRVKRGYSRHVFVSSKTSTFRLQFRSL